MQQRSLQYSGVFYLQKIGVLLRRKVYSFGVICLVLVFVVFLVLHFLRCHQLFLLCFLEGLLLLDSGILDLGYFGADGKLGLELGWSRWRVVVRNVLIL